VAQDTDPQASEIAGEGSPVVGYFTTGGRRIFGSYPASACSMIAQSSTVQVIGPTWSKVKELA
jgi:hypothetical protein